MGGKSWFTMVVMAAALAALPGVAWGVRPLTIEDTAIQEKGTWMVDGGISYAKSSGEHWLGGPLSIAYGAVENVEVGVGYFGGQMLVTDDKTDGTTTVGGWSDPYFYAKWFAVKQENFPVSVALLTSVTVPIGSASEGLSLSSWDYEAEVIVTREFEELTLGIDANVAYLYTQGVRGADPANYFRYGVAGRKGITEKLILVGEVFAFTPTDQNEPTTAYVNGGFQWEIFKDVWLDAAVGGGLTPSSSDVIATMGLTFYF